MEKILFEVVVQEQWERVFHIEASSEDEARELYNANKGTQVSFERLQMFDVEANEVEQ